MSELLRFYRQFGQFYSGSFAPLMEREGLTVNEVHVLLFLRNNPGCDTARDVTQLRGLSKSQVSEAVEQLAGKGLLLRTPDPADRRVVHLTVTPTGEPLAEEARAIQAGCGRALLEGVSPEDEVCLRRIMEQVLANAARLAGKERVK